MTPMVTIKRPIKRGDRWIARAAVRVGADTLQFSASASEATLRPLLELYKSHIALLPDGIAFGADGSGNVGTVSDMTKSVAMKSVMRMASAASSHPSTIVAHNGLRVAGNELDNATHFSRALDGFLGEKARRLALRKLAKLKKASRTDAGAKRVLSAVEDAAKARLIVASADAGDPSALDSLDRIRTDSAKGIPAASHAALFVKAAAKCAKLSRSGFRFNGQVWNRESEENDDPDPIVLPEYDVHSADTSEDDYAEVAVGAVLASRPETVRLAPKTMPAHVKHLVTLFNAIQNRQLGRAPAPSFGYDFGVPSFPSLPSSFPSLPSSFPMKAIPAIVRRAAPGRLPDVSAYTSQIAALQGRVANLARALSGAGGNMSQMMAILDQMKDAQRQIASFESTKNQILSAASQVAGMLPGPAGQYARQGLGAANAIYNAVASQRPPVAALGQVANALRGFF